MPAFARAPALADTRPLLAFDTGSPTASVAVVGTSTETPGDVLALRQLEQRATSQALIPAAREALAEAGHGLFDLGGVVILRGPGSFTGLRIGLATVLGLVQATGLPVAALSSFRALAAAAYKQAPDASQPVVAAVDARNGAWSVQRFRAPDEASSPAQPLDAAVRITAAMLADDEGTVIGFGTSVLAALRQRPGALHVLEAPPLAAWAACVARGLPAAWDQSLLTRPLYARRPATGGPKRGPGNRLRPAGRAR